MEANEILDNTARADILRMSPRRRQAVTAGVLLGMFLGAMEMTIVGTAMPTVISALGGLNHYSWVFSAYLITSTVTVPVWGKISDLYGRRLPYQIGIALFLLGSMLSGMAGSMTQLIVFRALQGAGAGALMPLAMTIIGDIYTLQERAKMQALFSAVWGLSSIVGPLIGGFITDQLSWHWVFYINIPFGLAAAAIIGFSLQEPARLEKPRIDYAGAIVLTLAITALMLALVESSSLAALLEPRNIALLLAAGVLLAWFVRIEGRAPDPIVPLELLTVRTVSLAIAASFFAGMAMFGAVSFVPLFAQGTLGATATEAGSMLTPLMLSWVALSVVGGRMLLRVGFRATAICGLILMVAGFVLLSLSRENTSRAWFYIDLAVIGAGLGLTMLTLLLAIQHTVSRAQLGIATSLNQFSRSIGGAVGVAVMGAVLSAGLGGQLAAAAKAPGTPLSPERAAQLALNPSALIDPAARADLPAPVVEILESALSSALHNVFWMCAVLSLCGLVLVFFLPRERVDTARDENQFDAENCERLLVAEMATIDADHEPDILKSEG
jgi:EmrB/QacA subfamily drug resistance transporter